MAGGARESVSSQFLVTIELDVKASNFSLFVVNFNIKSYFDELSEGGLKIFDNGGHGSGRHGREARRVSEWEFVNQFPRR